MIAPKAKSSKFLIGFASGLLNTISIEQLRQDTYMHLALDSNEELTCCYCCNGGLNILVGTSYGNIFIISLTPPPS